MAVQTSYPTTPDQYAVGQLVDTQHSVVISRIFEEAADFGKVMAQGTADKQVLNFDASAQDVVGISVRSHVASASAPNGYAEGDTGSIIIEGPIAVVAGEAVDVGDPVYVTNAGAFVATATGNTLIPNARFDTSGAQDAIVVVRLK